MIPDPDTARRRGSVCDEIRKEVVHFLQREMNGEMTRAMEEHLAGCSGCRDHKRNVETLLFNILEYSNREPSSDLFARIKSRIHSPSAPPSSSPPESTCC